MLRQCKKHRSCVWQLPWNWFQRELLNVKPCSGVQLQLSATFFLLFIGRCCWQAPGSLSTQVLPVAFSAWESSKATCLTWKFAEKMVALFSCNYIQYSITLEGFWSGMANCSYLIMFLSNNPFLVTYILWCWRNVLLCQKCVTKFFLMLRCAFIYEVM